MTSQCWDWLLCKKSYTIYSTDELFRHMYWVTENSRILEKQKFILNRAMQRKILPENLDDDEEKEEALVWCTELE